MNVDKLTVLPPNLLARVYALKVARLERVLCARDLLSKAVEAALHHEQPLPAEVDALLTRALETAADIDRGRT